MYFMKPISIITTSILIFNSSLATAQSLCAHTQLNRAADIDVQPTPLAVSQMNEAHRYLCSRFTCPSYDFKINNYIGNAAALKQGNSYKIRYNTVFMNNAQNRFGGYATIGILSHELGHLIDFNTNPYVTSSPQREATADRYAGCAFALAGAPIQNLLPMARTLHSMGEAGSGYPTLLQRNQLLIAGYNQCST